MRTLRLSVTAVAVSALAWCPGAMGEDLTVPIAVSCPNAPEERYFPAGTFYGRPHRSDLEELAASHDLFIRRWYSKHLAAMEEPSLSCGLPKEAEAYRFLLLPTWGAPAAVRVFRHDNDYRLEALTLNGAGGYDPGQIARRLTKKLSGEQWQSVIARLEHIGFWEMSRDSKEIGGTDGTQYVLEARAGAVGVGCPERRPPHQDTHINPPSLHAPGIVLYRDQEVSAP